MNERIRELELQAYVEFTRPERDPSSGYVQEITGKEFSREKFAKLIVRECEVALAPMLRDMVSRGQAYDLIKQHFGVE